MKTTLLEITTPDIVALCQQDPTLKPLFNAACPFTIQHGYEPFEFMVFTVLGQQLSTRVADLLFERVLAVTNHNLSPKAIHQLSDDALRGCGLSSSKTQTIKRLAQAALEGFLDPHHFTQGRAHTVRHLCSLKGLGPWSAEMFILFVLDDFDVFSVRDLGLYKAYQRFFKVSLTPQELTHKAASWAPYRAYVAHALWHLWDQKITEI